MNTSVFKPVLNQIHNDAIREFTIACLKDCPDYLLEIPASNSNKYHPVRARKEGGLVWHILRCCHIANIYFNSYQFTNEDIRGDIVLSALLLHDIGKKQKYNNYWEYKNHPLTSSKMVAKHKKMLPEKIFKTIQNCIIFHMGPWTPHSVKKDINKYNLLELIVYNSDYFSSIPELKLNTKDK